MSDPQPNPNNQRRSLSPLAVRLSVGLILFVIVSLLLAESTLDKSGSDQKKLLRFSAVALASGIGLAALIDSLVTRPILTLLRQVNKAQKTEWTEPLNVPQERGEITELGQALEDLRIDLNERKEALNLLNAQLEDRIQERTQELEDTQNQLLQAAKLAALGQLSTGVAHEINNPTSIILTRLGFLISTADEEGLDPDLIADLETLEHQTKRIAHITQSLLRFGRKSSLNSQLCSLEEIVDLTISILKHTAQKQNVTLHVEHQENATAYADAQSIEQVCFNLIKNAIESGATQVTVQTSKGQIRVKDNGEGMDEETLGQVFDPFFTTKEIGEGSGLGLSVSYGIVEKHRGQLKVTSNPRQGTCFTVTLPTKEHS